MSSPGFPPNWQGQNAAKAGADAAARARSASEQSRRIVRGQRGSFLGSLVASLIALGVLVLAAPFVIDLITHFLHSTR
ncbi:hypothetical protein SAMN04488564_113263 [Lentzea waywayandensis]|uniref:Uncharacterized protein n=1 Tax=Lentzea waywayandensis TaxID=84724 RepID=A0A1I6FEM5_9PSEU|nr:hypothetical protein [Lentzea waywayandensis]SFR28415.1 hypothetical protein SAMN04488564_113263 [Lentzea waywayandensis]